MEFEESVPGFSGDVVSGVEFSKADDVSSRVVNPQGRFIPYDKNYATDFTFGKAPKGVQPAVFSPNVRVFGADDQAYVRDLSFDPDGVQIKEEVPVPPVSLKEGADGRLNGLQAEVQEKVYTTTVAYSLTEPAFRMTVK